MLSPLKNDSGLRLGSEPAPGRKGFVKTHPRPASVAARRRWTSGADAQFRDQVVEARRCRASERLADGERNELARGDVELSGPGAAVRSLLIRAREDVEIARQVRQVLAGGASPPRALP